MGETFAKTFLCLYEPSEPFAHRIVETGHALSLLLYRKSAKKQFSKKFKTVSKIHSWDYKEYRRNNSTFFVEIINNTTFTA
jgi:hypothetical protein